MGPLTYLVLSSKPQSLWKSWRQGLQNILGLVTWGQPVHQCWPTLCPLTLCNSPLSPHAFRAWPWVPPPAPPTSNPRHSPAAPLFWRLSFSFHSMFSWPPVCDSILTLPLALLHWYQELMEAMPQFKPVISWEYRRLLRDLRGEEDEAGENVCRMRICLAHITVKDHNLSHFEFL